MELQLASVCAVVICFEVLIRTALISKTMLFALQRVRVFRNLVVEIMSVKLAFGNLIKSLEEIYARPRRSFRNKIGEKK